MSNGSSSPEGNDFYSSDEQGSDHSNIQEMMQQIQQMAYQSKFALLLQVIQLSTEHIEQRKQITQLRQALQKALDKRVLAKRDLIVQHTLKTNLNSIEYQKRSALVRLREKLDAVHTHIKSNDMIRSQLKEDDMLARGEVDEIRKELADLDTKMVIFENALKKGEAFVKRTTQQLNNASQEKAKIQEEFRGIEYEMRSNASRKAEALQKMKTELAEKVNRVKQCLDELQHEQQRFDELSKGGEQLQSEIESLRQKFEQQKQVVETGLTHKKQHFAKQKELLDKQYADQVAKDAEQIETLKGLLERATREDDTARQRVAELAPKLAELENKLKTINDSNAQLEREIENCRRQKQQELELVRLKESAKTTKTAAQDASVSIKPNILSKGRPKRLFQNPKPTSTTTNKKEDTDFSIASDTSLSFASSFCE